MRIDRTIRIFGLVQGVGFRPFAAAEAKALSLSGYVRNSGGIVTLRAVGEEKAVDELVHRLFRLNGESERLPGARVERIETVSSGPAEEHAPEEFRIEESTELSGEISILPPDLATCPLCERELFDPADRRYKHPFISCVSCGPRYTIMERIPYDRGNTVMEPFGLCEDCAAEYVREGDRRRHAQTVCCHECGPRLSAEVFGDFGNEGGSEDPVGQACDVIKKGGIVAIKDIGGYHLACLAKDGEAAARLREFKCRKEKPFAVMCFDVEEAETLAVIGEEEKRLLRSPERPIVLLQKKEDATVSAGVTGDSGRIGILLPCNPIQLLLLKETGPLVMTSGNRGGEPILTEDERMREYAFEYGLPDMILTHDRPILSGLDDSIVQVIKTEDGTVTQTLRRARGYVPKPVILSKKLPREAFAAGGDLKNVFALGKGRAAYLSGHFGDLADAEAQRARRKEIGRMEELLGVRPEAFIGDRHPAYFSSAMLPEGAFRIGHHHAHIASVMAEHALSGPVLGLAFDGTGYGDDGTVWGGEFLLCEGKSARRAAHFTSVELAGGDAAARYGDRCAYAYLYAGGIEERKDRYRLPLIEAALSAHAGTVKCSSAGRLFDAAAAVLDIAEENTYEGQAPMRLQQEAERWERENDSALAEGLFPLPGIEEEDGALVIDTPPLIAELFKRARDGEDRGRLAYAFHAVLACVSAKVCVKIRGSEGGPLPVALSGGSFANALLFRLILKQLKREDFKVYWNEQVPCGDGGLALGQLWALCEE